MKLFWKLMIFTVIVGMVPLVIGGILLIGISRDRLETNIQVQHLDMARHTGQMVENHLRDTVRQIGTGIYESDLRNLPPEQIASRFSFLLTQYPNLRILTLVDKQGQRRAEALPDGEVHPDELTAYATRIPFEQVMKEGQIVFSDVYPSVRLGRNLVAVGYPYHGDHVISAEVSLDEIQSIVAGASFGERGHAFLVDNSGRLIAHPDRDRALKHVSLAGNPAVDAALASGLPGIGRFTDDLGAVILESHQPVRPFKKAGQADWMLFVREPEEDAFAASRHMAIVTTLLIVGTVIVGLGAGLLLTRSILIPLYRLVGGTREIASGNLAYRVEARSRDEFGMLSAAFDRMGSSLQRREKEIAGISEMAKSLGSVLDLDSLLDQGLEAFEQIVGSDRIGFMLGSPPVMKRSRNWPEGELPLLPGTSTIINNMDPPWNGFKRILSVPLVHENKPLGYLVALDKPDGTPFVRSDRRDAEIIASAVSTAVINIRLLDEMVEKTRMQSELETAEIIQRTLFPRKDLREPGLHLSGSIRSASETGGDWYGYLRDEESGRVGVLIGDVTGHGVSAALVTASAHSFFRSLESFSDVIRSMRPADTAGGNGFFDPYRPENILQLLNRVIFNSGEGRMNMTFFVAIFDLEKGVVDFANAGHPLPYVLEGGEKLTVLKAAGPRLGESLDHTWVPASRELRKGDVFAWITDGIVEAEGPNGRPYGERRIRKVLPTLKELDVQKIKVSLLQDLDRHLESSQLEDDVTLVVGKIPAAEARPQDGHTGGILMTVPSDHEEELSAGFRENGGLRMLRHPTPGKVLAHLREFSPGLLVVTAGEDAGERQEAFSILEAARDKHPGLRTGVILPEGASGWDYAALKFVPPELLLSSSSMSPTMILKILECTLHRRALSFSDLLSGDGVAAPMTLHRSKDRKRTITAVVNFLEQMGAGKGAMDTTGMILSEFLMNAFFDAPRDETGRQIHLERRRNEEVDLPQDTPIEVKLGLDDKRIYLSVSDPFGALTAAEIHRSLRRGMEAMKTGIGFDASSQGAGIGLHMSFQMARSLVVNLDPGTRTEIIAEIRSRGGRSSLRRDGKSLAIIEV